MSLIRKLSQAEIDKWLDFLTDVYKQKGTPRQYFLNHWLYDPHKRGAEDIWALFSNEPNEIVSSVRCFHRQVNLYINNQCVTLSALGIGEVATLQTHRRKGYARSVLEKCIKDNNVYDMVYLHAQPGLFDYYRAFGFRNFTGIPVSTICFQHFGNEVYTLQWTVLNWNDDDFVVLLAGFYDEHVKSMKKSMSCRRSMEYWRTWIKEDCLFRKRVFEYYTDQDGTLIGYIVHEKYTDHLGRSGMHVLEMISGQNQDINILRDLQRKYNIDTFRIHGRDMSCLDLDGVECSVDFDNGWMYISGHDYSTIENVCISRLDYF
jgi:hypothetical protein